MFAKSSTRGGITGALASNDKIEQIHQDILYGMSRGKGKSSPMDRLNGKKLGTAGE